jgi:4-hydroxy-tetrahydrodipicolinate reductase
VLQHRSALVWSPNFSVGVAVFRRLAGVAAKLLSGEDSYGAWVWEIHHDQKKDAPSGTLLRLVETMRTLVTAAKSMSGPIGRALIRERTRLVSIRRRIRSRSGIRRGAAKGLREAR